MLGNFYDVDVFIYVEVSESQTRMMNTYDASMDSPFPVFEVPFRSSLKAFFRFVDVSDARRVEIREGLGALFETVLFE